MAIGNHSHSLQASVHPFPDLIRWHTNIFRAKAYIPVSYTHLLQVVEETQVRGTVEKTYSLADSINSDMETMVEENSGKLYMQYFMQYFIGFAKQFQKYCQSPNINIKKDMTGFSLSPLYLSDDELTALVTNISQIIGAVKNNEPTPKRKLRTIGIIVSPAENTEK